VDSTCWQNEKRQTSQAIKNYKPHGLWHKERRTKSLLDERGHNIPTSWLIAWLLDDDDNENYGSWLRPNMTGFMLSVSSVHTTHLCQIMWVINLLHMVSKCRSYSVEVKGPGCFCIKGLFVWKGYYHTFMRLKFSQRWKRALWSAVLCHFGQD
jgi:hypothetical protein